MVKIVGLEVMSWNRFYSFWDRNVRPSEPKFDPADGKAKALIAAMVVADRGHGVLSGGYDNNLGQVIQLVAITDEDKKLAMARLAKIRHDLVAESSADNDKNAILKLQAFDEKWGSENPGHTITHEVISGNRRDHCLPYALIESWKLAGDLKMSLQEIRDRFNTDIPVQVVEYESDSERKLAQLAENNQKTAGFDALSWVDFFITVWKLHEIGKITSAVCRKIASSPTISQRTWHLMGIGKRFPKLNIKARLTEMGRDKVGRGGWLDWAKMDHAQLPNINLRSDPDKLADDTLAKERAGKKGDIMSPLDQEGVEDSLQAMMGGARVVGMKKDERTALKDVENPFVKATAKAMETGDKADLERVQNMTAGAVSLEAIYNRSTEEYEAVATFLNRLAVEGDAGVRGEVLKALGSLKFEIPQIPAPEEAPATTGKSKKK